MTVQIGWVGREVRCPHCGLRQTVPPLRDGGRLPRGGLPPPSVQQRLSFACPRCRALLESRADRVGQIGHCPTCGTRFRVPGIDPNTQRPELAVAIDGQDEDPTPMHAYAAAGYLAPRIHRLEDGTCQIECPRCAARCDITANNCHQCGMPFSTEGVPTASRSVNDRLGTASLVLGILGVPLCPLLVPGVAAIILGLASWLRRPGGWPRGHTLVGLLLGLMGVTLGVFLHL